MTDPVILDSSALLALLNREPGHDLVRAALPGALMSTVNVAEVVSKLVERGAPAAAAAAMASIVGIEIQAFTAEEAQEAGALRSVTREAGLSLGDRACLALAKLRSGVALTADRRWTEIAVRAGAAVQQIRP